MNRFAIFLAVASLYAYPSGSRIPNGNAGEPGTGTPCASCHSVTLNPSGGHADLALPGGNVFRAGEKQRWTVTVTDPDASKVRAFQLTASAGTFTALSGTVVNNASNGRQYVSQSSPASSFSFEWTPPSAATSITVWLAGVAARGTRQTNVYTTSVTLQAAGQKPAITSSNGVVNGASFAGPISPGSWVTIFGSNLAPAGVARSWKADEIVDGRFPLTLEGTSVKINGKAAAISYVSAAQLNIQAPDDASVGPVSVTVTTADGTSDAYTADLRTEAPALFRFNPESQRYAAAVHADGTLVGPPGLFGEGVTLRAAKPGDIVLLFGTGFGATSPQVPSLQVFSGAASLAKLDSLRVRIGGVSAAVSFAGLSGAGLDQINVAIPDLAAGVHLIEIEIAGQTTAQTSLAVTR